jgi:phage terminase large subunit-like protein
MSGGLNVIDFGQGFNELASPSKSLLEMVIGKRLSHGGNPVLRWMATNATAEFDGDAFKFSKKKSSEKIDGIVALAMAIGRAQCVTEPTFAFAIV